jgi:hypothetical protein
MDVPKEGKIIEGLSSPASFLIYLTIWREPVGEGAATKS